MKGQTSKRILGQQFQRVLRKNPTPAEARLWQHLRLRQLDDCKFRRQHPHHNAVLDFVCLERKLVIELDGSHHAESAADRHRDARITQDGFLVLRFWNNEVLGDLAAVLMRIHDALISQTTGFKEN